MNGINIIRKIKPNPMRKKLLQFINFNQDEMVFAIKRQKLKNKTEKLLPVVRRKNFFDQWIPIVFVDNKYMALPLETDFEHNEDTCKEYIEAYRKQVTEEQGKKIIETYYQGIN